MANKFKEAAKRERVAPGGESAITDNVSENIVDNTTDNATDNTRDNITENILENRAEPSPTPTVGEMLTGKVEKKPEGKSVSLYLTTEAMENLEKFAKANKCSKSKAADLVFRSLY